MFLHWREDAKIALHPAGVIVADVTFNHLDQLLLAGKPSAIVTLPFLGCPRSPPSGHCRYSAPRGTYSESSRLVGACNERLCWCIETLCHYMELVFNTPVAAFCFQYLCSCHSFTFAEHLYLYIGCCPAYHCCQKNEQHFMQRVPYALLSTAVFYPFQHFQQT